MVEFDIIIAETIKRMQDVVSHPSHYVVERDGSMFVIKKVPYEKTNSR